uniref:Uncharacterized protein n=1 Tax=Rhizophora mucronata TaxID=61149 RepID=A0A2P2IN01_RHIMU
MLVNEVPAVTALNNGNLETS